MVSGVEEYCVVLELVWRRGRDACGVLLCVCKVEGTGEYWFEVIGLISSSSQAVVK